MAVDTQCQTYAHLIVDRKTEQDFIEIKSGEMFRPKIVATFEKSMPETAQGYLLCRGEVMPYSDDIQVVNHQSYLA